MTVITYTAKISVNFKLTEKNWNANKGEFLINLTFMGPFIVRIC
jgi:hypothetical protein